MCEQHEQGHFADIYQAFDNFKSGTWTEKRYTDYVQGTSRVRSDVIRRMKDERDRHAGDVNFLQRWLDKANREYADKCLKCS